MNKKNLLIISLLIVSSPFTIQTIDPVTAAAASAGVKKIIDIGEEYIYSGEKQQRRILKKHLLSNNVHSVIFYGCNENFTNDCSELAKYFQSMEKYYANNNEMWCLRYQAEMLENNHYDATKLFTQSEILRQEHSDMLPYFESLSPEEQEKILALQRKLVIEHAQFKNYKQEIERLQIAVKERY